MQDAVTESVTWGEDVVPLDRRVINLDSTLARSLKNRPWSPSVQSFIHS